MQHAGPRAGHFNRRSGQFLTVGPVFAPEVFKFDPKKFDPVQNLKAKFKLKTLVELLKSVIKITVASWIIYDVMYDSLPVLIRAVSMPMASALLIFHAFLMEVVIKVGLFFLIVAVADFVYQKKNFASEMKMEKFEIKQEYKNSEGDPHIKSKRRQIAQEIAYQEGPVRRSKKSASCGHEPHAFGHRHWISAAKWMPLLISWLWAKTCWPKESLKLLKPITFQSCEISNWRIIVE